MSTISALITLKTFFHGTIFPYLSLNFFPEELGITTNRIFMVDRLRLQIASFPNLQVQMLSMVPLAPNNGINCCVIEYKIHVVTKVEYDMGDRLTERLVGGQSSYYNATLIANKMRTMPTGTAYSRQMFVGIQDGAHDDKAGITSASVQFKTYLRNMNDG